VVQVLNAALVTGDGMLRHFQPIFWGTLIADVLMDAETGLPSKGSPTSWRVLSQSGSGGRSWFRSGGNLARLDSNP
jgi:hypothetical protein